MSRNARDTCRWCSVGIDTTNNREFCSRACYFAFVADRKAKRIQHSCEWCGRLYESGDSRQTFCSHSCAASATNRKRADKEHRPLANCGTCGKRLSTPTATFCSQQCRADDKVKRWLNGEVFSEGRAWGDVTDWMRNYLFSLRGRQCWECGWEQANASTGVVPVEIDHIDGDSSNNLFDNLRVLCPNCHSLTPTFRGLNKESARSGTRKSKRSKPRLA